MSKKNDAVEDARIKALGVIATAAASAVDLAAIAADKARTVLADARDTAAGLSSHERVCTERYGNIDHKLNAMDSRLNAISNRMWAAAIGTISAAVVGFCALAFFLLTHWIK